MLIQIRSAGQCVTAEGYSYTRGRYCTLYMHRDVLLSFDDGD